MKTTSFKSTRLVISLLAAGVIGGAGVTAFHAERAHAAPAPVVATSVSPSPNLPVALPNFAQIVQRYGPAVVNISVTSSTKVSDDMPMAGHQGSPDPFGNDPFFEFFRQFEQGQGQRQGQGQGGTREVPMRAEGSGFIISPDGLILTNAHVVRNAKVVTVKLTDRREFRAKVLGADPKTDIAVLKIDAHDLPVVALDGTSNLQVG
ncbi:MAG: trypsin-like peptidase domain-containing protein, partial [Rhodoferax sp.]